jgi:hypothetical protein
VWLFSLPLRGDYCCQKCGHTWRRELEEQRGKFGIFLGDWTDKEITELESGIDQHQQTYEDWYFFKGRKIFTGWRASDHTKLIRTFRLDGLDGLIWWVQCANVNPKWYGHYQKAHDDRISLVFEITDGISVLFLALAFVCFNIINRFAGLIFGESISGLLVFLIYMPVITTAATIWYLIRDVRKR